MAKVMLVEDDNNLREIYGARLLAEGYVIVAAKDGEEALAMAVKEKPDLIISDIMMPKISGFDMLDILRSTAETKNTKVIMMTALSQAEDKERADKLGADRYLIKSQVTLEDVAKAAREVLAEPSAPNPAASAAAPAAAPATDEAATPAETPVPTPVAVTPAADPAPVAAAPATDEAATPAETPVPAADPAPAAPAANPTPTPTADPAPAPAAPAATKSQVLAETLAAMKVNSSTAGEAKPANTTEQSQSPVHSKVIKPINDLTQAPPDLEKLAAEEEAKEAQTIGIEPPTAVTSDMTSDSSAQSSENSGHLVPPTPSA